MSAPARHWITRLCDHVSPRTGDAIVIALALAGIVLALWLGSLGA